MQEQEETPKQKDPIVQSPAIATSNNSANVQENESDPSSSYSPPPPPNAGAAVSAPIQTQVNQMSVPLPSTTEEEQKTSQILNNAWNTVVSEAPTSNPESSSTGETTHIDKAEPQTDKEIENSTNKTSTSSTTVNSTSSNQAKAKVDMDPKSESDQGSDWEEEYKDKTQQQQPFPAEWNRTWQAAQQRKPQTEWPNAKGQYASFTSEPLTTQPNPFNVQEYNVFSPDAAPAIPPPAPRQTPNLWNKRLNGPSQTTPPTNSVEAQMLFRIERILSVSPQSVYDSKFYNSIKRTCPDLVNNPQFKALIERFKQQIANKPKSNL